MILITDDELADDELVRGLDACLAEVSAGGVAVQLRDRKRLGAALLRRAESVAASCQRNGAKLIVNDRLDVAKLVDAAGVHLGGASVTVADARPLLLPETIVTVSAHTPSDVMKAARDGATAALVSPIFDTPGKGPPRGIAFLGSACRAAGSMPIFALGGIDARRASDCLAAGAYGVAAIRAVFSAGDPAAALSALSVAVERAVAEHARRST